MPLFRDVSNVAHHATTGMRMSVNIVHVYVLNELEGVNKNCL